MKARGAKEKLIEAFDNCQEAYEDLVTTKQKLLNVVEKYKHETDMANERYQRAKKTWEETLKACAPGDIGAEEKSRSE